MLVVWSLIIQSIPAHKEFRFLLPALQLAMPLVGCGMAGIVETARSRRTARLAMVCLFTMQAVLFGYFGMAHHG